MKAFRKMWLVMQALWLLYMMCYKMASLAQVKATNAHQRIDVLVAFNGNVVSGAQPVGQATNATNAANLDLGNGNLTSMFTGSVAAGANNVTDAPTTNWFNPASNTTVAQVVTNINGGLVTKLNSVIDSANQTATAVSYIQSELSGHKFSST
jgi:hypothetical protein